MERFITAKIYTDYYSCYFYIEITLHDLKIVSCIMRFRHVLVLKQLLYYIPLIPRKKVFILCGRSSSSLRTEIKFVQFLFTVGSKNPKKIVNRPVGDITMHEGIVLILTTEKWGVVPWKGPDDVETKLKMEFHTHNLYNQRNCTEYGLYHRILTKH
jgi:hypothetical protein